MTTTFEDNTEVTLSDLNNVAVDLGYTDFSAFSNEKFGVDQLNQITSDLVSAGVLRTGASGSLGCEVIASGEMAYVQPGVIVFASGAKLRIKEPVGVILVPGTYIYALADSTTGAAKLEASNTEPAGDYVMLAKADAEGVIADRRSSCVAKVALTADAQNVYSEFTIKVPYKGSTELNVGGSGFLYVSTLSGASESEAFVAAGPNMAKLEDGTTVRMYLGRSELDYRYSFWVTRDGQSLIIKHSHALDLTINLLIM